MGENRTVTPMPGATILEKLTIENLAVQVKSNYQSLNIGEIINRIHYITGKSMQASINGYKILREKKLIPDNFVKELELENKYLTLVSKPNFIELIERMGCTLGRVIDFEKSMKSDTQPEINFKNQAKAEMIYNANAAIERALSPNPTKNLIERLQLSTDF